MRSLIISVSVFILLCAFMVFNFFYINNTVDDLRKTVEAFELENTQTGELICEFEKKWKKIEWIFGLSVSYKEIDFLGETLISLSAAYENRDKFEFERHRSLLFDALDGVCRLERFSVMNIF